MNVGAIAATGTFFAGGLAFLVVAFFPQDEALKLFCGMAAILLFLIAGLCALAI